MARTPTASGGGTDRPPRLPRLDADLGPVPEKIAANERITAGAQHKDETVKVDGSGKVGGHFCVGC